MKVISFQRAGTIRRAIAFWLDAFVLSFIIPILTIVGWLIAAAVVIGIVEGTKGILEDKAIAEWATLIGTFIGGILPTMAWGLRDVMVGNGRSIGKYLLGMKVYEEGEEFVPLKEIGISHSFLRNLPLVLLYAASFFVLGMILSTIIEKMPMPNTLPPAAMEALRKKVVTEVLVDWNTPRRVISLLWGWYILIEGAMLISYGSRIGDMLAGTMVVLDE